MSRAKSNGGEIDKSKSLDFLYGGKGQCSFNSLIHACIDMTERIAVLDDVILDCTMIYRPKNTSVKRYGVRRIATLLVPCFVCFHYLGGQTIEHNILVFAVIVFRRLARQELLETIEGGGICFRSPDIAILLELDNQTLHKVEQRVLFCISAELVNHIVGGV